MTSIDHKAFFINGAWRAAEGTGHFDAISPRSEQSKGGAPAASKTDLDAAVAAARHAFGSKKSGLGRKHGPDAVQEYLLTKTISIDPGEVLPESVTRNVPRGTGPGVPSSG